LLDASEGFIPLWDKGVTLRWRFQDAALRRYRPSGRGQGRGRAHLGSAILAWGDAAR
jgi:hypothetical protein